MKKNRIRTREYSQAQNGFLRVVGFGQLRRSTLNITVQNTLSRPSLKLQTVVFKLLPKAQTPGPRWTNAPDLDIRLRRSAIYRRRLSRRSQAGASVSHRACYHFTILKLAKTKSLRIQLYYDFQFRASVLKDYTQCLDFCQNLSIYRIKDG